MQTRIRYANAWRLVAVLAAAALLWYGRSWLWQAVVQLFWGMMLALAALPVMKQLEKRLPPGAAAACALAGLVMTLAGILVLFAPPLIRQGRELGAMLPSLYASAEEMALRVQRMLSRFGFAWESSIRQTLFVRLQEWLSAAIPAVVSWLRGVAGGVGKWMLVPVFAYYFLRDRETIGRWLLALAPVSCRRLAVRTLREMRRETAGYLRGQLMACAVVGALTAVGLLCCGVPSWLFLGFVTGVLELIPYLGPVLGGVTAVLFALPGGTARTLWALGVVVAVQQLEGMVVAPKLMSQATRLHPLWVVVCVTVGGAAAGLSGIFLSVPLLLCARAALRVFSLRRFDQ